MLKMEMERENETYRSRWQTRRGAQVAAQTDVNTKSRPSCSPNLMYTENITEIFIYKERISPTQRGQSVPTRQAECYVTKKKTQNKTVQLSYIKQTLLLSALYTPQITSWWTNYKSCLKHSKMCCVLRMFLAQQTLWQSLVTQCSGGRKTRASLCGRTVERPRQKSALVLNSITSM